MLITLAIFLSFSIPYLIATAIISINSYRHNSHERKSTVSMNPDHTAEIPTTQGTERFSYKRDNITIEIPDNDAFVNYGQAAFVLTFLRENYFPFSIIYLKTHKEKLVKLTKWYFGLCLELTTSLFLLQNFSNNSDEFLIVCPIVSCIICVIFIAIFSIAFRKGSVKTAYKWINIIILTLVWCACLGYNITAKIMEIENYYRITLFTVLSEVFLFEFFRTSMKMACYVWLKQANTFEEFIDSL